MRARYFLDTNIFVYTFDPRDPDKQAKARQLIENALTDQAGLISSQVVQEFLNVATRKFERPLSLADARSYLNQVLAPLCEVFPSTDLFSSALSVSERWQYAFYDSLIVSAALQAKARFLYSEDLQHGQQIEQLTILNPFDSTPLNDRK